jgi:hypothetical protein
VNQKSSQIGIATLADAKLSMARSGANLDPANPKNDNTNRLEWLVLQMFLLFRI